MKTKKYDIVIDKISEVFGGWHSGYAVDVNFHREADDQRDGYESRRVSLNRDRLFASNDSIDKDAVLKMVVEEIGETEEIEINEEGE